LTQASYKFSGGPPQSFVPCTLGVFASQMRHGLPAASVAIGL